MPHILALDQGTTSSRAVLYDSAGRPMAQAQEEFPQHYPEPGHVEHDPDELWGSQLRAAQACLVQAGLQASDVAAIGIANQRETTLLWDADSGDPVYRALVWQDRRTAPICDEIRAQGLADEVFQRTGLIVDPYFSATKVMWLLRNVPQARALAERDRLRFGTMDTYLVWRLTGGRVHATDPSNASRTMLYNILQGQWDEELLRAFDVPVSILPEVRPTASSFGTCDPGWLGAPVPIVALVGDQQAALFGQTCTQPGEAKATYGTGCFVLMNVGREPVLPSGGLLATIAWDLGAGLTYAIEGSVFVAGAAVQWLRDGLGAISTAAESEALAASVPDSGGVYFVPAFVGLGAPHWDPHARGLIVGLTRGTTRAHLARATLDAIAFQTRDVLDTMAKDADLGLSLLRVDGGATRNDLLLQTQADVLGTAVERPRNTETTALGAAYMAGHAIGHWADLSQLRAARVVDRTFAPMLGAEAREERYSAWSRAVTLTRGWNPPA